MYAGVLALAEALMVAGIVLHIHLGAHVGLPARLNTPYDAVAGAIAADGFRRGTIVAGPGPLGGNLRLAFPDSRVASLETPGYLPPPAAGAAAGECLLVWDHGTGRRDPGTISARGSGRASASRARPRPRSGA